MCSDADTNQRSAPPGWQRRRPLHHTIDCRIVARNARIQQALRAAMPMSTPPNITVKSLPFRNQLCSSAFFLATCLMQARLRKCGMLFGVWGRRAGQAQIPNRDTCWRHLWHVL
jgi:hypothetical protein